MKSPITKEMSRRIEQQKRFYKARRVNLEKAFPEFHFEVIGSDFETKHDVWLLSRRRDMEEAGLMSWNQDFQGYGFVPTNLKMAYSSASLVDILRFLKYAEEGL